MQESQMIDSDVSMRGLQSLYSPSNERRTPEEKDRHYHYFEDVCFAFCCSVCFPLTLALTPLILSEMLFFLMSVRFLICLNVRPALCMLLLSGTGKCFRLIYCKEYPLCVSVVGESRVSPAFLCLHLFSTPMVTVAGGRFSRSHRFSLLLFFCIFLHSSIQDQVETRV